MPQFVLKHHQAVWETTTVEVDAPDVEYVKEHAVELIAAALEKDTANIASGDRVASVDSEYEIYDERGTCLVGTGATAALLMDRPWLATYRVRDASGDQITLNTVEVKAPTAADAVERAVAWAHDNDPYCDERIDYYVEADVEGGETEENDDAEVDPAG